MLNSDIAIELAFFPSKTVKLQLISKKDGYRVFTQLRYWVSLQLITKKKKIFTPEKGGSSNVHPVAAGKARRVCMLVKIKNFLSNL